MFINRKRNEGPAYAVFKVFNLLFMFFIIFIMLFPYLNVLAKALNDGQDTMLGGIGLWPRKFTLENFKVLLSDSAIYQAARITITRVVLATSLALIAQFMTGYALSRNLKGTKVINAILIIPTYIGGGVIATYILYSKIGLLNNFSVYIIPGMFSFYNMLIIRSYISTSISNSIIEAAYVDGISELGLFSKIILPLSKPILATIALWLLVANWNDWNTTLLYVQNPKLHTLQYKLMQTIKETERMTALIQEAIESGQSVEGLMNSTTVTTESITSAQIIVVTLPIIMVYPFIQKYFTQGITLGAVKG